ncbi:MAG: hypothetical protein Q8M54_10990 [Desulfobaccales bacterium]|nr:hypothetical protein [Desulfobaccales bacterium]
MAIGKIADGRFLAQCQECGKWLEVQPLSPRADSYFELWDAEFRCCGLRQTVRFTLEKDTTDFH